MKGNLSIDGTQFEELGRAPKSEDVRKIIDAFGFEGNVVLKWAVETQATFGQGSDSDISGYLGSNLNEEGVFISISIPQIEAECRDSGESPVQVALSSFAFALSDLIGDCDDLPDSVVTLIKGVKPVKLEEGFVLDIDVINAEELSKVNVSMDDFCSWIKAAMSADCLLTISFIDPTQMQEMNNSYRGKNYPTNVLTFDYPDNEIVAADIALCRDVLLKEAQEQGKTIREHLAHLTIHGVLHAHGYDHIEEDEAEEMEAKETEIMISLGFDKPYSDPTKVHD